MLRILLISTKHGPLRYGRMVKVQRGAESKKLGRGRLVLVFLPLLLVGGAVIWAKRPQSTPTPQKAATSPQDSPSETYSNVRHRDYVGPTVCKDCHSDRYDQWQGNLHRKMNRLASETGAVLGDFEDRQVPYADGSLVLTHEGEDFFMSFAKGGEMIRRFRITRTIGTRYLQEYVGIQMMGPEASGDSVYSTEIRLPFGYLMRTRRWLSQQYFDSWHGAEYAENDLPSKDAYLPDTAPWRGRCAWCHNTYSFDKRLARLQGEEQVGSGIEQFYVDAVAPSAEIAESKLLPLDELVSVGISCESCHFGGRAHAALGKPIRFAPHNAKVKANPDAPALAGTRSDSPTIVAICAQCHSATTEVYPNGAGTRNSSEALDLMSGDCASRIRCTHCHDPHVPGPGAMAPVQRKHLQACVGCHQALGDAEVAREHSGHSDEVNCLDCHMPRIVQGISSLLRSHRISKPTEVSMLTKSVNACNLCHLDQSVAWTVIELRRRFRDTLEVNDLSATPAALLWLESDQRIHRLTAAGAIGIRSEGRQFLPKLIAMLNDPVAYDRQRYLWAIEGVIARRLSESEFSLTGTPEVRRKQALKLLRVLSPPESRKKPAPL